MEKQLSSEIPLSVKDEIIRQGKENFDRIVYRVAKWGIEDSRSYLGSYDEYLVNPNGTPKPDLNEIGGYSTSCNLTPKCPRKILKCLKRKYFQLYPCPVIVVGRTVNGLSQETYERIPDYKDRTHIDWWIYAGYEDAAKTIFRPYNDDEEG